jgi:FHA domain
MLPVSGTPIAWKSTRASRSQDRRRAAVIEHKHFQSHIILYTDHYFGVIKTSQRVGEAPFSEHFVILEDAMNQTQTACTIQLIPEFEGAPAHKIAVQGERFLIGRDDSCQLRPNSKLVSRWHAEISVEGEDAFLRDLDSSNGTFLNSLPVTSRVRIHDGDTVQFGPLEFRVSIQQAAEPPRDEPAVGFDENQLPSDEELASWLIADRDERPSDATHKSR